ncbi:MAG: prepilin-type N-terminal cleavage/methylation domain-containing protein [Cyanobacteria bacterium P01_F01_bin.150]
MTSFLLKFLMATRLQPDRTLSDSSPINPYFKTKQLNGSCSSSSGFSLLEMIVIVVIVGVLAAIAAPSWLGMANRQRVNTTRNEVLQAIRTTQSTAKQRRRPQELGFTQDGTNDLPTITLGGVSTELGSGNLKADMVNMNVTDGGGNALSILEFREDGTLETEDPAVTLPVKIVFTATNGRTKRCLLVETLLGSVRSESDDDCL